MSLYTETYMPHNKHGHSRYNIDYNMKMRNQNNHCPRLHRNMILHMR